MGYCVEAASARSSVNSIRAACQDRVKFFTNESTLNELERIVGPFSKKQFNELTLKELFAPCLGKITSCARAGSAWQHDKVDFEDCGVRVWEECLKGPVCTYASPFSLWD